MSTALSLTTTFTPPAACTSLFDNTYYINGAYFAAGPLSTSNCFPDGYNPTRGYYFSPGICPTGYTSACSAVNSLGTLTQTTVTCCPESYSCYTGVSRSWQTTLVCKSSFGTTTTTVHATAISDDSTLGVQTLTENGGSINAYGIAIEFEAADFVSTSQATSTSTTSAVSSPSATSSLPILTFSTTISAAATASSKSGNQSPSESAGLSTGAVVGIAVGSIVGGISITALAVYAFFLGRRSNKPKRSASDARSSPKIEDLEETSSSYPHHGGSMAYSPETTGYHAQTTQELPEDFVRFAELAAPAKTREVHEMGP